MNGKHLIRVASPGDLSFGMNIFLLPRVAGTTIRFSQTNNY